MPHAGNYPREILPICEIEQPEERKTNKNNEVKKGLWNILPIFKKYRYNMWYTIK